MKRILALQKLKASKTVGCPGTAGPGSKCNHTKGVG